jgi:diguanylate cyclase (GGDEF)-like protein
MHLGNQGTAFLPDGGILPGGAYPVYMNLDVDDDGAALGELHFACEPRHPPPISIGAEFDLHVPHPDSILGDTVTLRVRLVDDSGSITGYVLGSTAQFRPPSGKVKRSSGEDTAKDDLLPVLRRKVFDQELEALSSSASEEEPVSLLMLDLDHFKAVNDSHGHPVGDEVLIECANTIARRCRYKGRVYRFGGEEIAVLLPNFTLPEAVALAESIRCELEASRPSSKKLSITASIGVATAPVHATEGKQLLEVADEALYAAKHLGRNLVRTAGQELETSTGEPKPDVNNEEIHLHVGQPVNITLAKIPKDAKPGTVLGPFKFHVHGATLHFKEKALLTASSILDFVVRRERGVPPYPSSKDAAVWSKEQAILRAYDAKTLTQFRDGLGKDAIAAHDQLLRRGLQDPALDRLYNDPGTPAGIKVIGQKLRDLAEKLTDEQDPN